MRKLIIIPDSFKGTMSSKKVGTIIQEEAKICWPKAEVIRMEVADGGEGSVDAFLSVLKGKKRYLSVTGPYGEQIESFYGQIDKTAVIEMSAAAGLPLVGERLSAGKTTTYGVGELVLDALEQGAQRIIIGLGGSATNDGGAGLAAALGVEFFDIYGNSFIPIGDTLCEIDAIDLSGIDPRLDEVSITAMCDIDNCLCGETGAAVMFGPQKGATAEDVIRLDQGLRHFAKKVQETNGIDILHLKGGGAAGGMGAGIAALLGAKLESGIEVVLETIDFESYLKECSLVITGEGRIDEQSAHGKVICGVARRAKKYGVPVLAVAGAITDGADSIYDAGVSAAFAINRLALPYEKIKERTHIDLRNTIRSIFRFTGVAQKIYGKE